ncbi:redoxin domain-containing protein [Aquipuribacter nitratireducens]|uniref:Redoxin domain-containing protein n=1 Tax=Aquipuribacter nitratireducens TaxID=650104 RepID=A0ABW0GQY5_9MICO
MQGTTLDGDTISATELDGPVVYWFWAPWCTVCRAEAPTVAEVAKRWEGEVTFLGVASRGPQDDMDAFVVETGTGGIRHIADLDGSIWAQLGVSAQPAFVFVDREGVATGWLGGLGEQQLDDVTASLAG